MTVIMFVKIQNVLNEQVKQPWYSFIIIFGFYIAYWRRFFF